MRITSLLGLAAAATLGSHTGVADAVGPSGSIPIGQYEVVAVRAASDVARAIAHRRDPSLARLIGRRVRVGAKIRWYDGRPCAAGVVRTASAPWPNLAEPNLSDVQLAPGPRDHRLNRAFLVDCGSRPGDDTAPVLMVDRRVLITLTRDRATYVVLEAPVSRTQAMKVEAALAAAGLNPGPVNGKLDAAARRAIAQYARRKGAAFAFQSGVLTENLVAALTAQEGAVKPND